jgi:hypothetical protein
LARPLAAAELQSCSRQALLYLQLSLVLMLPPLLLLLLLPVACEPSRAGGAVAYQ